MASDALSRYPWTEKPVTVSDVNSAVVASLDPYMRVVGWEDVKDATLEDAEVQMLSKLVQQQSQVV